jgi:2C-methyl-D-erythritol 2,4-cyclodiphosphate synthase
MKLTKNEAAAAARLAEALGGEIEIVEITATDPEDLEVSE